jgi:hypothetical protein
VNNSLAVCGCWVADRDGAVLFVFFFFFFFFFVFFFF